MMHAISQCISFMHRNDFPVDINRPENIVAQGIRETSYIYAPILPWNAKKHFAVTAIDRYGNESRAVQK